MVEVAADLAAGGGATTHGLLLIPVAAQPMRLRVAWEGKVTAAVDVVANNALEAEACVNAVAVGTLVCELQTVAGSLGFAAGEAICLTRATNGHLLQFVHMKTAVCADASGVGGGADDIASLKKLIQAVGNRGNNIRGLLGQGLWLGRDGHFQILLVENRQ